MFLFVYIVFTLFPVRVTNLSAVTAPHTYSGTTEINGTPSAVLYSSSFPPDFNRDHEMKKKKKKEYCWNVYTAHIVHSALCAVISKYCI